MIGPTRVALRLLAIVLGLLFGVVEFSRPLVAQDDDPPEVLIGQRLFLETRFAEHFSYLLANGIVADVNTLIPEGFGDPVLDTTVTLGDPLSGPFAGMSMNCRACHLVSEQVGVSGGGMRTYSDFARRSPIPDRGDGRITTVRNSPPLVNASLPRRLGLSLHLDGEFASLDGLVKATFSGRNFGWEPGQRNAAVAHLVRVIREDNGLGPLAQFFGALSYQRTFLPDSRVTPEFRLPPEFQLDVTHASDEEILNAVAKLVSTYTEQLVFSRDDSGDFNGSPFDVFLRINGFDTQPQPLETDLKYSRRLISQIEAREKLRKLQFVNQGDFLFHNQPFQFGQKELNGLKIFFREDQGQQTHGVGNCIGCHAAPNFTDFSFHNTGITQFEYDAIHGAGSFSGLFIPDVGERNAHYNSYLPATEQHPTAHEVFRRIPTANNSQYVDLGMWNIFANPDIPAPQENLNIVLVSELLHEQRFDKDTAQSVALFSWKKIAHQVGDATLLRLGIARFKTPGLRDLGHAQPYMHNGQIDTIEDVLQFYRDSSDEARAGTLRNPDIELRKIFLDTVDIEPLAAFLRSLNEDYIN